MTTGRLSEETLVKLVEKAQSADVLRAQRDRLMELATEVGSAAVLGRPERQHAAIELLCAEVRKIMESDNE